MQAALVLAHANPMSKANGVMSARKEHTILMQVILMVVPFVTVLGQQMFANHQTGLVLPFELQMDGS